MNNRYDEMKLLLKRSRVLLKEENELSVDNVGKSIENSIDKDKNYDSNKKQGYKINGDVINLYGNTKRELEITTIEKKAFVETISEFNDEVSELAEFGELNLRNKSIDWSGKITNYDLEFIFIIGENQGVYLNCELVKLDDDCYELLGNLKTYFDKFSIKWGEVLNSRKELAS